ncbi:MAG TPA: hypothetical protein VGL47_03590 [Amycolatopsis sp.]|uniref:Uncharacterized protein n=1 Tax=Amycolatopsis nalaikhensis TaxID=715472 RepID=A0ABY8XLM0_9PSEU|nr:hypothetical protein [Amycolatopsis sp. 2-2]WIV56535.1 hypothetical protein QP939_48430 [Amycolatopsis sp. 2-2]
MPEPAAPVPADPALAARFTEDLLDGCRVLARDYGYRPAQFERMVREHGGVEAARLLLRGAGTAGGFTMLWEKNQLGRSSEATMLREEYAELFTPDELLLARRRLEEHGFDVDAHLRRIAEPT